MEQALREAEKSLPEDVPVGMIVVSKGEIVGSGYNRREERNDPTLHAEIMALRQAARRMKTWHLEGSVVFVTLEPCPMCAGALILARVERVVFGAHDPKSGALGSVLDLNRLGFNHKFHVRGGVCEEQCATLLRDFFQARRGG